MPEEAAYVVSGHAQIDPGPQYMKGNNQEDRADTSDEQGIYASTFYKDVDLAVAKWRCGLEQFMTRLEGTMELLFSAMPSNSVGWSSISSIQ